MSHDIIRVSGEWNHVAPFRQITIIGDPGCDGLGASTMAVFARALSALDSDFNFIVGDIVHRGIESLYHSVTDFTNSIARAPVYMLCGNHDTAFYDEFFGLHNYALVSDTVVLIVLDDAKRRFDDAAIDFLARTLDEYPDKQVVLLFHIPPPNRVGTNTIAAEEWAKIEQVIASHRQRIRYIICGHVHSYYEDDLDGIRLLVTGGGGARIEYVSDSVLPHQAVHHVVRLSLNAAGMLEHEHVPLETKSYTRELEDATVREQLERSLVNESMAHLRYRFYADDAAARGYPALAAMFRAFADSEYYHARNHFLSLNRLRPLEDHLRESLDAEDHEVQTMYREFLDYSRANGHGLAAYSFLDSLEAEKVHHRILVKALEQFTDGSAMPVETYHTCTSCGYTFVGEVKPAHCPVCGAPADRIAEVG